MNMSNMCVIGAGRMGSLYGALLAKNGLQVTLYDPWRQHIDTIRQNGLRIDGISGDLTIRIPATAEIEEIAPCEIALVLSDTNGTAHAAEVARRVRLPVSDPAHMPKSRVISQADIDAIIAYVNAP